MVRKTDPQVQENIDRDAENEQRSAGAESQNNNYREDELRNESDNIKNANATGLGAIGRNDQGQTGKCHSSDAGND